jgi:GAF domain-containing protein/anti-sigma regulatory factor (Ser/Thr protein kinase)
MPTQAKGRAAISRAAAGQGPAAPSASPRGRAGAASRLPAGRDTARELADAREQLAATSEILGVIARSAASAQPVFDAIAAAALRLCGGRSANVFTYDGELVHLVATAVPDPRVREAIRSAFPRPLDDCLSGSRAILRRAVVEIPDVFDDPTFLLRDREVAGQVRSVVGVPLMSRGEPIGSIAVGRPEPGPFPEAQVAMLATFAEQAVIAIENARLFTELQARNRDLAEALEQQTATSEVLRVISSSPTDAQPVFDTIARAAMRLCNAGSANVFTFDGQLLRIGTVVVAVPEAEAAIRRMFPRPADRGSVASRAVLVRSVVTIPDVKLDPDYAYRGLGELGFRSALGVPLLRNGEPIGAIAIGRPEAGPFPPQQVALLQTFADQAVIAIENARLFGQLQTRNRDLAEALEQQTATAEILRVISRSPTDVQPVFDTIAAAALRLCNAASANVFMFDGRLLHIAAMALVDPEGAHVIRRIFPRPPDRGSGASRAVMTRSVVQIHDVLDDPDFADKEAARVGFRSILGVPLMHDGEPIGAIAVGRSEPGSFPQQQVALLQTFSNQAVIAIENLRLFSELQARTAELTQSVEELRALGEIGQAISSSLDLEAVLRTIVAQATALADVDGAAIFEYDAVHEAFRLHAADRLPGELVEALAAAPMAKGEGVIGRLAITGEPVAVADISDGRAYGSRVRDILLRHGFRSLLAVPLLREDRVLGGLVVNRRAAGEFPPRVIALLRTFATQSALAIHNAHLFRELEDKSRQLEIASRHKSRFLASMSHELRTPLNAIIGFTRIVMRKTKEHIDAKQLENLEKILASAQHLLSLINAVLDLAKIEAGRVDVQAAEVQPAEVLEQCTRTVEPLIREGVALQRDFEDPLPPLWTDGEKLRQIVFNLLSNAAKFTAAGSIRISARASGEALAIAVADTGTGIPADRLEAVFEEFEQVESNGARAQGTGLGLAIARRLARLMGGDLRAESTFGGGSTFTLTLPLRDRPEQP